jgi:glycerol-3-phosphate acyltransferase PlsY
LLYCQLPFIPEAQLYGEAFLRFGAVIVISYLLGSLPFGYLIVRATQGADVRESGSGGTGATNVSRRAGKAAGVLTLVLDALKGAAAVVVAKVILGSTLVAVGPRLGPPSEIAYWWLMAAAIAVLVGHIFPVWLRFRGGKGVATGVGVFLILSPMALALAGAVFLVVVISTRYVSLGSIMAAVAIPLFLLLQNALIRPVEALAPTMTAAIAGAALIVFAHRANIGRLLRGAEIKFE